MKEILLIAATVILSSALGMAQGNLPKAKAKDKARELIKTSCEKDFETAGCVDETGPERVKCLREYKKANKEFKVSEACRMALSKINSSHKNTDLTQTETKSKKPKVKKDSK